MSNITLATIKSFIKRNSKNLFIKNVRVHNSMVDGCESVNSDFIKVDVDLLRLAKKESDLGVPGADFAMYKGRGGDLFSVYDKDGFVGYEVYNCVGTFIIAVSTKHIESLRTLTIDTRPEVTLLLNQKGNVYTQIPALFEQYKNQIMDQIDKAFGPNTTVIFCNIISLDGQYYAMFYNHNTVRNHSYWFGCPVTLS